MTTMPNTLHAATLSEWIDILTHGQGTRADCQRLAQSLLSATGCDRVTLARASNAVTHILVMVPPEQFNEPQHFDERSEIVKAAQHLISEFICHPNHSIVLTPQQQDMTASLKAAYEKFRAASGLDEVLLLRSANAGKHATHEVVLIERSLSNPATTVESQLECCRNILPVLQTICSRGSGISGTTGDRWRFAPSTTRAKWFIAFACCIVAALTMIPFPFSVPVEGSLEPVVRRAIYAPEKGVLSTLLVEHGKEVKQGEPLIVLNLTERELEAQKIRGEIETGETQLLSLRAAKTQGESKRQTADLAQLTAQEEDLKIRIIGLKRQLELVQSELDRMTICSPIDGVLVAWEAQSQLRDRPVQQGEYLFEVHQPSAGWETQIEVPDRFIGYVLTAQERSPTKLTFRVRSDARRVYAADVSQVDQATQLDEHHRPYVPGKATLKEGEIVSPRSGARIVGSIDCGYKPLGFVMFRELIDMLRRNFWI